MRLLYSAASPKDGICVYLIMPTSNTACFQAFLDVLARKFARHIEHNPKLVSSITSFPYVLNSL
jgi:hypothetical protein